MFEIGLHHVAQASLKTLDPTEAITLLIPRHVEDNSDNKGPMMKIIDVTKELKILQMGRVEQDTSVILALRRQGQSDCHDFGPGLPTLQNELQDSQCYIEEVVQLSQA